MKFHKIKNRRGLNDQLQSPDYECEEIFWEFPSSGRRRAFEVGPIPTQTLLKSPKMKFHEIKNRPR